MPTIYISWLSARQKIYQITNKQIHKVIKQIGCAYVAKEILLTFIKKPLSVKIKKTNADNILVIS